MKKTLLIIGTLAFLSGCSLTGNPDQENFDREYENPDFSQEEAKLLNGEISE